MIDSVRLILLAIKESLSAFFTLFFIKFSQLSKAEI